MTGRNTTMSGHTEIDLEIVVDGVTVRGHASICGFIRVHMTEPFNHTSEHHYGFFRHPPKTIDGKIFRAKAMLESDYRRMAAEKAKYDAERTTKSAEEWAAEAEDAYVHIIELQDRIRQIRKTMMGKAKQDFQQRKITQEEYIRIRDAYKSHISRDIELLNSTIANRKKFLQYTKECLQARAGDK